MIKMVGNLGHHKSKIHGKSLTLATTQSSGVGYVCLVLIASLVAFESAVSCVFIMVKQKQLVLKLKQLELERQELKLLWDPEVSTNYPLMLTGLDNSSIGLHRVERGVKASRKWDRRSKKRKRKQKRRRKQRREKKMRIKKKNASKPKKFRHRRKHRKNKANKYHSRYWGRKQDMANNWSGHWASHSRKAKLTQLGDPCKRHFKKNKRRTQTGHLEQFETSLGVISNNSYLATSSDSSRTETGNFVNTTLENYFETTSTNNSYSVSNGTRKPRKLQYNGFHLVIDSEPTQPGMPKLTTKAGQIIPWWKSQSTRLNNRQTFASLEHNGTVTIRDSGLYYVYSQITYFDQTGLWANQLMVGDQMQFKCIGQESGVVPNESTEKFFHTEHCCNMGGVTYINQGESVALKSTYGNRTIHANIDMTFWGIIKL